MSCDAAGNYQRTLIDIDHFFESDEDNSKIFNDCNDNRNNEYWKQFCQPICESFHPTHINEIFKPQFDKIKNYSSFLEKQLLNFQPEKLKPNFFQGRILQGSPK